MKPKEFDELIRQKFDQNDFPYNAKNWDKMEGMLEGRTQKRTIAIWWLPMMGIAAALSVSMGFATYMRHAVPVTNEAGGKISTAQVGKGKNLQLQRNEIINNGAIMSADNSLVKNEKPSTGHENTINKNNEQTTECFGINLANVLSGEGNIYNAKHAEKNTIVPVNLLADNSRHATRKHEYNTETHTVCKTFKDQTSFKQPKSSVNIIAGINYTSSNNGNGFMLGTTGRTMISDKVYIEGDIAFTGSNNTQRTASEVSSNGSVLLSGPAARTTSGDVTNTPPPPNIKIKVGDQAFNMYYAQFTPTIGYQLISRMSIGVGPDFQQALTDNRPAPSILDRDNVLVTPLFDIGLIAKSEFTLNRKIKAAIFYREGINNFITPMDKYINRNYFQFQLKYAVFSKIK